MKKRNVKKSCDHGRMLNRIELKKGFNILAVLYLEEQDKNKELTREMLRTQGVHNEILIERDETIERTKTFNNNLAIKLQDKIADVAGLENEVENINFKYLAEMKRNKFLKEQLEMNQVSLRFKHTQIKMLKEINSQLEDEIKYLKMPIWKRFILKRQKDCRL